jgi:hypothetical protein
LVRYVILLTIAGIVGGIIARRKGRSPIWWFILCALFPLLIIVVALLPPMVSRVYQKVPLLCRRERRRGSGLNFQLFSTKFLLTICFSCNVKN